MNSNEVEVIKPDQLPLFCAGPGKMQWSGHPRVFLPMESHSKTICPWCGCAYYLDGEMKKHH